MNRIEKRLEELKQENKKAFITYTTAGLPDLQTTAKLIFAQEEAGADILEIGSAVFRPGSRRPGDSECLLSGNPERHNAYKDF